MNKYCLRRTSQNQYVLNPQVLVYLELFDISQDKNQTTDLQYFQILIINWICRSSNLESNFTGMAEGAKIEAAECLGQRNRKLVADERSPEPDSGHDSGRLDRRSCSLSFCDRISSSDGEL